MAFQALVPRTLALCRGTTGAAESWIFPREGYGYAEPLLLLAAGGGAYGAAMGAWRDPLLALFVAIKLPVLLAATAAVDALLNFVWARRLGFDLGFGDCLRAVILSFALASIVLGALAPVVLWFDSALPSTESGAARLAHDALGLAHVAAIACAGIVAVSRQRQWMRDACRSARTSDRLVYVWLAANLVVGAQISWNLRPWFGSPTMAVEFVRGDAFQGTFYESVYRMLFEASR